MKCPELLVQSQDFLFWYQTCFYFPMTTTTDQEAFPSLSFKSPPTFAEGTPIDPKQLL